MTLAKRAIEPTRKLEPDIKLLLVHAPFILHDVVVGVFSLLQSYYESNVFIKAIYWKPSVIVIFPLLYNRFFDQFGYRISFKIILVEYFVFFCVVLFYVVAFAYIPLTFC
jgi:hypothetical protein